MHLRAGVPGLVAEGAEGEVADGADGTVICVFQAGRAAAAAEHHIRHARERLVELQLLPPHALLPCQVRR